MPGPSWLGHARCSPTPVADRPGCGHHPHPHERRRRTNAAADRGDECAFVQASNTLRRFGVVNRRLQLPVIRADTRFAVAQAGQAARLKVWRCRSGYALAQSRRNAVSKAQRHPLRAPGRKRAMPPNRPDCRAVAARYATWTGIVRSAYRPTEVSGRTASLVLHVQVFRHISSAFPPTRDGRL